MILLLLFSSLARRFRRYHSDSIDPAILSVFYISALYTVINADTTFSSIVAHYQTGTNNYELHIYSLHNVLVSTEAMYLEKTSYCTVTWRR